MEHDESGQGLLNAYQAVLSAFQAVEAVGGSLTEFGNSALLEIRSELEYTVRRLRSLALAHGASPAAVETSGRMNDV